MASFSMEDFVGNGVLKELLPKLSQQGRYDVPTFKVMTHEDMEGLNMTQQQKDALEIRSFLHDHALLEYGDKIEGSGKNLTEIQKLSAMDLSTLFSMKRSHVARFKDRNGLSAELSPILKTSMTGKNFSIYSSRNYTFRESRSMQSGTRSLEQSLSDMKIRDGYIFKGVVASDLPGPRTCGRLQPHPAANQIAPYSAIENIYVQKLTPEYTIGTERSIIKKAPQMKTSDLWRTKPAIFVCIRRPGCIMCRAEAHQLYSKKHIFDALGVQLFAVLRENIESEVKDFWPRYWGGAVFYDRNMQFFKALGGGKLQKEKFLSGFLFNPRAILNYKRAKAMGVRNNFKGEGEIKGGLLIVGSGKSGIAYQFVERNFGDWAPIAEVIEICNQLQTNV